MTFSSPSRTNTPALLAVTVLHGVLFSALLAQYDRTAPAQEGNQLAPIQWLLPLVKPPAARPPEPEEATAGAPPARRPGIATRTAPTPAQSAASAQPLHAGAAAQAAEQATPPVLAPSSQAAPDPFDVASTPAAPGNDALLRRQDWGAGKADHELRGGKLARLARPADTFQAGLERAFRDAGEAVPPKWYERAEIREVSVPEGRTRMYKIRTAMGTYCFYKPDPSLQATYDYKLMTCPREK